jgi:hypothetical protein
MSCGQVGDAGTLIRDNSALAFMSHEALRMNHWAWPNRVTSA